MSTEQYHDENQEPEQAPSEAQDADQLPEEEGSVQEEPNEPAATSSLEEKLKDLQGQHAELRDQYLRKAAEFENFRKRINREKQEAIDFANQSLLLDLIPIIDDFERAIKAADASQQAEADFTVLYEGISMIEKRLSAQLEHKWGLKRYDSSGEPFDPNRHEAIMMEKSPDIPEPVVQEDFIKGYTLKDRVIRSAKVKVLMPEQPAPGVAPSPDESVPGA
ncbi:MAG: nucleotide exchange factor GrpE [Treponema sp.]|jgi:molecular chaperone GrpE|nr:nucleotide exchange factor GrpE [Treponema sp.]